MKKTLLGFLLLIISCKLNAQQQKLIIDPMQTEMRPELLTKGHNSVKDSNVFIDIRKRINANRHELRKTSSSFDWKRSLIEFYNDYDYSLINRTELYENGLLASSYYKITDPSSSSPYLIYDYSYDDNGNIIEEIGYQWKDGKRVNRSKYTSTNNSKNLVLEENYFSWRDSIWVLYTKDTYSYNSNNLLMEKILEDHNGDNVTYSSKYTCTYNNDNLLIEEVFSYFDMNTWWLSSRKVNTYNSENLCSETLGQDFNTDDNTWYSYSKTSFKYNNLFELIEKTSQTYEDSGFVDDTRNLYAYDDYKNISEEIVQWSSSGQWDNIYKYNYENDSDGNIISKSYSKYLDEVWTNIYKVICYTGNEPFIELIHPLGGNIYDQNSTAWLDWFGYGIDKINLDLSSDNGQTWNSVVQNQSYDEQYEWIVPAISSTTCLMKVSSASNSSYYDMNSEPFTIQVKQYDYLDHETGTVTSSVFNNGIIGSTGDIGSGFIFKNYESALYSGGLIYGTPSKGIIGMLGSFYINDFAALEPISDFTSDENFDQILKAHFTDSNAPSPLGLTIEQSSFSKNGSDIIYYSYNFINNTAADIDSLSIGLFADWDISTTTSNLGGYDISRNIVYQHGVEGTSDSSWYGLVALNGINGGAVTSKGENRLEFYSYMTNKEYDEIITPNDCRSYISSGPYNLAANKTLKAGFAIIAGESLEDLKANADTALSVWNNILVGVNENETKTISTNYSLEQNYPNPFNPSTTIRYSISKSGLVQLKIYDILGREVAQLVNEEKSAGTHEVKFNGTNLSSGIYFYRITSGNFTQTKKLMLLK